MPSGGLTSAASSGGTKTVLSGQFKYNPEEYLTSSIRALEQYAKDAFHKAVRDSNDNPVGNQVFEIIMEYPEANQLPHKTPLTKTLIHFAIDDIENPDLGFGDNIFRENYDPVTKTSRPQEARLHRINFDVGVWTSDRAGGTTMRLRAYEILTNLFKGSIAETLAYNAMSQNDGSLEILRFSGGRFFQEKINDIVTYRIADCMLDVRVYSRTPLPKTGGATIEQINQDQDLEIDNIEVE
jgi:hypothetical protein